MLKTSTLFRVSAAVFVGLTVAACVSDTGPVPPFYTDLARPNAQIDVATAAQMISQYRTNNGKSAVQPDASLTRIAQAQADAMAKAGSVRASLAGNMSLKARLVSIGEDKTAASENVSAGYHTLAEAFSGWRESPKHNAVLLSEGATRMGIATAYAPGAKHRVFWSLIMATPPGTN